MRKLIEDARIGLLGAAAGLFSSSVLLLIDRIDRYYAYLSSIDADYNKGLRELWWLPVSFWHVLLSVVASFLVHRYLTNRVRSPFLLWQVVGITTLLGWGLSIFLLVSLQCVMSGDLDPFEHLVLSTDVAAIAKYVSVAFACNVFYGSVINASSRQYAEQFESD
jgi:hypothetical protein